VKVKNFEVHTVRHVVHISLLESEELSALKEQVVFEGKQV